jgi:hypothetical protein
VGGCSPGDIPRTSFSKKKKYTGRVSPIDLNHKINERENDKQMSSQNTWLIFLLCIFEKYKNFDRKQFLSLSFQIQLTFPFKKRRG